MRQQQWQPPTAGSSAGGGSVRKARERAEAGLPPQAPEPLRPRPYEVPRGGANPQPLRQRPQAPAGFSPARNHQGQVGVLISRPTQVPQWPLAGTIESGRDQSSEQYQPPPGRSMPPQRPPRPSHVPSILDASRLQEHTPSFQYNTRPPQEQPYRQDSSDDNIMSPDLASPMSASSRPSTISSVGTIPDFPIPAIPAAGGRRSANLGPPPTSRRGASSYYSQASFVSPIPEESPRSTTNPSHQSYASSAAIPSKYWGPDSPGYGSDPEYSDDYYDRNGGFENHTIEEGRESRESNGDDSDDRGLIRSASLGKRAKPSLVSTKSFEKSEPVARPAATPKQLQSQTSRSKLERMGVLEAGAGVGGAAGSSQTAGSGPPRQTFWPMVGNPDSPLASGTGLIDNTPSTSEESIPTLAHPAAAKVAGPSPTPDPSDNPILGAYNSASSLAPGPGLPRTPSPGFSRLSAIRRPPRLDIDAVRDAEARGSLTSLPDLIRRATKLAAMMDRGKRPASRMNDLSDFPSDIDLSSRNKELSPDGKHNSGLSGMLAAFPPPGLATPRDGTPRPQSSWPSPFTSDEKDSVARQNKPRRRCCGMPCWVSILLLIGLIIIIAAAVVVPLYFFVIKKNNNTPLTALEKCQQDTATTCQNGGTSSLSTGTCSCLCINGFTGSTCTTHDEGACTAFTLRDDSVSNITLGDAIPRLILTAQSNFSVPLSEQLILARFNTADLSCVSQNALVTFDGQSRRVAAANVVVVPTATSDTSSSGTPDSGSTKRRRQDASQTTTSRPAVGTDSSGIIFDSSESNPSSSSTPSTALPSSDRFNITQEVLDFGRVAVLYVLQQESLDNAVNAQTVLQRFFGLASFTNGAAGNVSLGNGNAVNLLEFKIDVGEGSVGGRNRTGTATT